MPVVLSLAHRQEYNCPGGEVSGLIIFTNSLNLHTTDANGQRKGTRKRPLGRNGHGNGRNDDDAIFCLEAWVVLAAIEVVVQVVASAVLEADSVEALEAGGFSGGW
jgi:hypothetical protein